MSSTNDELTPPPSAQEKPRVSPLEFRNTDLVSRLLAATPPYLYNMPLVPHSYFFSEMLRSFVQAKAQQESNRANNNNSVTNNNTVYTHHKEHHQQRRSRKRGWSQMKSIDQLSWQQKQTPIEPSVEDNNGSVWSTKSINEKPLELTMNKLANNNNKIAHKIADLEKANPLNIDNDLKRDHVENYPASINNSASGNNLHHMSSAENNPSPLSSTLNPPPALPPFSTNLLENNQQSDLILPPPPPIWYPPIYPSPYGIDPLHFFIDLRVSGHIYDRKKEANFLGIEKTENSEDLMHAPPLANDFKQTRHTSAFSVPIRSNTNNNNSGPINLSNGMIHKEEKPYGDTKNETNKVSTHYVMQNLQTVYNKILEKQSEVAEDDNNEENGDDDEEESGQHQLQYRQQIAPVSNNSSSLDDNRQRSHPSPVHPNSNLDNVENKTEDQKKCKDLSALIGLELVVDYVKQEKPKNNSQQEKPIRVDSPDLEIVETHDGRNNY